MILAKTTLVLGAGASAPYGFPLGKTLVDDICALTPNYLVYNPGHSDHNLTYPLHPTFTRLDEFKQRLKASRLYSVDAFLAQVYASEPDMVAIGKAAIAATLIPFENATKLQGPIERDWCRELINSMGRDYEQLRQSAENLSVVTFNYDRSLEYCLYMAFGSIHGQQRAIELVKTIDIVHVYGQLGVPHFLSADGRDYSTKRDHYIVANCASQIHVMPESSDDSPEFTSARALLAATTNLCFLGFGYDQLNMKRLKIREEFRGPNLYGTAFELTGNQRAQAQSFSANHIKLGAATDSALEFLQSNDVFSSASLTPRRRTGRLP